MTSANQPVERYKVTESQLSLLKKHGFTPQSRLLGLDGELRTVAYTHTPTVSEALQFYRDVHQKRLT